MVNEPQTQPQTQPQAEPSASTETGATHSTRRGPAPAGRASSSWSGWWSKPAAVLMAAVLAWCMMHYPGQRVLVGAGLALYCAALAYRPALWLLLAPALLPVADLAPWTGWFFIDEFDLILLATCAVAYWRQGRQPIVNRLPGAIALTLGAVALCYTIAAVRGMLPLTPLDANAFSSYLSHYNSLREYKGLIWGLLLLPLLRRTPLDQLRALFVPGMLAGLALASLALAWERQLFPGLFNFSSDYRPTGSFSAMHTGGAALDAYLAMSFPFVAYWLMGRHAGWRVALALGCALLGIYSGLTTFSRDIYAAYACSGGVLLLAVSAGQLRGGRGNWRLLAGAAVLLAALSWILMHVFATGGYRGLLAALGLVLAALALGGAPLRLRPSIPLVGGAVALLLAAVGLALYLPGADSATGKSAYLAYVLAAGVCAVGAALLAWSAGQRALGLGLLAAAFPALAASSVLVGIHWGGQAALPAAALAAGLAVLLAATRLLPTPLWRFEHRVMTVSLLGVIVYALLIPVGGSYYAESRFSTVGGDLDVRVEHWTEALDIMDTDWLTTTLGAGLGRYPESYLWRNLHGETPATFSYLTEPDGTAFLRLGAAHYAAGYGEVLRLLQHVAIAQGHAQTLSLDVRTSNDEAVMETGLCERWLIYPQNCQYAPLRLQHGARGWVHYSMPLAPQFERGGLLQRPIQLEMANAGAGAAIDVRNVSLRDTATGDELLANGDFASANDHWFFSSDRNHFPWHIKNFAVDTVFETGWLGAAATAALLLMVGVRLLLPTLAGDAAAAVFLAALGGVMMVGLFDSLVDVARLTTLMLLLMTAGTLAPVPPKRASRSRRH